MPAASVIVAVGENLQNPYYLAYIGRATVLHLTFVLPGDGEGINGYEISLALYKLESRGVHIKI